MTETQYAVTYAGSYESALRSAGEWGRTYSTESEAIQAAASILGDDLVEVEIDDGMHSAYLYYRTPEEADADQDGSDAIARVSVVEEA